MCGLRAVSCGYERLSRLEEVFELALPPPSQLHEDLLTVAKSAEAAEALGKHVEPLSHTALNPKPSKP